MIGNTVKDGSGEHYWIVVDGAGHLFSTPAHIDELQSDVVNDDSDKVITVPAGEEWLIKTIYVSLVTSATAGDRQLAIQFRDGSDNVIFEVRPGAVQAASLTRYYNFAVGMPDMTSFRDTDLLTTPLPDGLVLPTGYNLRIYDNNAVSASADDMHIRIMVGVRQTT